MMTVEDRLEELEKGLGQARPRAPRVLAVMGIGIGLLATALAILDIGAARKEVRAKAFLLEGERGEVRARLAMTEYGPMFFLYDDHGDFRAVLGVNKDNEPGLRLLDDQGRTRAGLAVRKEGPVLVFFDGQSNKGRVTLKVDEQGPTLQLGDENGFIRAALAAPRDGPRLFLHDENGNNRARIAVRSSGTELALWDEKGRPQSIR